VVGPEGEMIGVMSNKEALERAQQAGLDLIEIAPNATPPVCKIMDFGKFKYQEAKKEKQARKKQHTVKLKEIKLRPNTDDHDYGYKMKHAREFLEEGDRVKITIVFRGREMAHLEFGKNLKEAILNTAKRIAVIASGDLSHCLTENAPAKFNPAGKEFDDMLIKLLKKEDAQGIVNLDKILIENAAECGLRSILILLGILNHIKFQTKILSYEAPFGVGYLVANLELP